MEGLLSTRPNSSSFNSKALHSFALNCEKVCKQKLIDFGRGITLQKRSHTNTFFYISERNCSSINCTISVMAVPPPIINAIERHPPWDGPIINAIGRHLPWDGAPLDGPIERATTLFFCLSRPNCKPVWSQQTSFTLYGGTRSIRNPGLAGHAL